jgi:broad specificity phosphatase PhoE
MNSWRSSLCLLALGFVSLARAASPDSPAATAEPVILFVVRHAEKSAPNGDLPLSAEGRARADALVAMLGHAGVSHMYSTEMIRARETAAPLAQKLGLTPKVIPVAQTDALVADLKLLPPGSVVLVVNHSGTIPALLEKLGAPKPAAIQEEQYDRLFLISRVGDGGTRSVELRYGNPSEPGSGKH